MAQGHTVSADILRQVFSARDQISNALEDLCTQAEDELQLSEDDILDNPGKYRAILQRFQTMQKQLTIVSQNITKVNERINA